MREARHYQTHQRGVVCGLCPKNCVIPEGRTGFCRVRKNVGGKLYTLNYGACSSYALDPVEKKPLYHFHPGATIFSIGTWGCNFVCRFCQNWEIAQADPATRDFLPETVADLAAQQGPDCVGVAYTYSEPTVWFEYVLDTARAVRARGLANVLVTNGFINPAPLAELLPLIDAMNIDVKGFTPAYYRTMCAGELSQVQRTVEQAASRCHVEITTLLVPGLNDTPQEIETLSRWLASLSPDIPLHFSRYFPQYKLDLPPTPLATLQQAREIAREHLHYVYIGNVAGKGVHTYCYQCGALLLDRLRRTSRLTPDLTCPVCGAAIRIIGTIHY